jgi:hypothetical protein
MASIQLNILFQETQSCIHRGDFSAIIKLWEAAAEETRRRYYELSNEYDPLNPDPDQQQLDAH